MSGKDQSTVVPRRACRRIEAEVMQRYLLLARADKELQAYDLAPDKRLRLASTDVFVEKAQYRLTIRARWLFAYGAFASASGAAILATAAYLIFQRTPAEMTSGMPLDGKLLTLIIIKAV